MLNEFVAQFTDRSIEYIKINDMFFLKDEQLSQHCLSEDPTLFGLYLGKEEHKRFIPSFNLLDLISKCSEEKVFVNEFGELDFLYGKDIRKRQITKVDGSRLKGSIKLVQNTFDENLGYGIYQGEQQNTSKVLTHVLDRGVFIKRDKRLKK